MKFFEQTICQEKKQGQDVCGDTCLCARMPEGSVFILCDGVGSGVYANIAAISCAERMLELVRRGISLRTACETIAASMHKARETDIPFSAFSAAVLLPDGSFTVYTYESPAAIVLKNGVASILNPHFYTVGYEALGEATGSLEIGEALILCSDGVTQAGLGHGYGLGIGPEGIVRYVNKNYRHAAAEQLPREIVHMCSRLMQDHYEDDTTLLFVHCREAKELSILTGPPSQAALDNTYVDTFMRSAGIKVVCGSTTANIVSRELDKKVEMISQNLALGAPPVYHIEGIELTTEGALMLNQVYNLLDVPPEQLSGSSVVHSLCILLAQADVVHLFVGGAVNQAHEDMLFKQTGVRARKTILKLLIEKLRAQGKLVVETHF